MPRAARRPGRRGLGATLVAAYGARHGPPGDQPLCRVAARLGCPVLVVVRSHRQLANIVAAAPEGFGADRDTYLSDVVFLKVPLTPAEAMRTVSLCEGVDRAWAGRGVVYFQRLAEQRSRRRFSSIVSTPQYQLMTIRNWSTTSELLAMLDQRRA